MGQDEGRIIWRTFTYRVAHFSTKKAVFKKAVFVAATALLTLTVFHEAWLPPVGQFLVVEDPVQDADAIVPLAGERSRVFFAADLFGRGYARWFVITDLWVENPNPVISYTDSVMGQALDSSVPRDRIVLVPGTVASTYQEAQQLRLASQREGWRSLIVVTSPFHSRRARMILRDIFAGTGIAVTVRPVPDHWYVDKRWWRTRRGLATTGEEYLKLGLYLAGYHRIFDR